MKWNVEWWVSRRRNPPFTVSERRITPEPVIGPRFARTRWANPPLLLGAADKRAELHTQSSSRP
jgi:hypothetical protein